MGPLVDAPNAEVPPFWAGAGFAASLEAVSVAEAVLLPPNRLAPGAGVVDGAAEVAGAVEVALGVAAEVAAAAPPKRLELAPAVAGLEPPNKPPDGAVVVAVVADDGAVAGVVVGACPNRPPLVVPVAGFDAVEVDDGAAVPDPEVSLAPNKEPAVEAPAVGAVEVAEVVVEEPENKELPAGAEDVALAGFAAPNSPPAGFADDCALPKSPDPAEAVVDDCVAGASGLEAAVCPNSPPPLFVWPEFWNRLLPADLEASAGGAPAGVVDGKEKSGLAGVVAPDCAWVAEASGFGAPNSDGVVVGAAVVGVELGAAA